MNDINLEQNTFLIKNVEKLILDIVHIVIIDGVVNVKYLVIKNITYFYIIIIHIKILLKMIYSNLFIK